MINKVSDSFLSCVSFWLIDLDWYWKAFLLTIFLALNSIVFRSILPRETKISYLTPTWPPVFCFSPSQFSCSSVYFWYSRWWEKWKIGNHRVYSISVDNTNRVPGEHSGKHSRLHWEKNSQQHWVRPGNRQRQSPRFG